MLVGLGSGAMGCVGQARAAGNVLGVWSVGAGCSLLAGWLVERLVLAGLLAGWIVVGGVWLHGEVLEGVGCGLVYAKRLIRMTDRSFQTRSSLASKSGMHVNCLSNSA